MQCSTISEENLSSSVPTHLLTLIILFDIIRHLYRLSIGMELSWNVWDQLWLLFCCSGQADACWSICHYAKFSSSVPLLFPSKMKRDIFRSEAIHVGCRMHYIFFFFFFFRLNTVLLDNLSIELGFVAQSKWFGCIWQERQLLWYVIIL